MAALNYSQTFGTVGALVVTGSRRAASSIEPGFPGGSISVVTVTPASGPAIDVYSVPASFGDDPSLAVGRAVVRALQALQAATPAPAATTTTTTAPAATTTPATTAGA